MQFPCNSTSFFFYQPY